MKEQNSTKEQFKIMAASNACLRRNLIRFSLQIKQEGFYAYHDELTGLPNRSLIIDRLHQAMQQAVRQHKQVLLIFIGLNRFKWINDTLGHVARDILLQQVAMRLADNIRGADTACRYGWDEFVVMMPEIESWQCADVAVRKIRAQLSEPYAVNKHAITLTASVGTAFYCGDEQSCEELLQQADIDMHLDKANSKQPIIARL